MDLTPTVIGSFFQGQPVTLALKFYDAAGDLSDASDPRLTLFNQESGRTIHYLATDISHDGTGEYSKSFALPEGGSWAITLFDAVSLGAAFPCVIQITGDPAYGR